MNAVQKGASRCYHAVPEGRARTCAQQPEIRSLLFIGRWSCLLVCSSWLRTFLVHFFWVVYNAAWPGMSAQFVVNAAQWVAACIYQVMHECSLERRTWKPATQTNHYRPILLAHRACNVQFIVWPLASLGGKPSGYSRLHDNSLWKHDRALRYPTKVLVPYLEDC